MTMLGGWRKIARRSRRSVVRRRRLSEDEVRILLLKTQGHIRVKQGIELGSEETVERVGGGPEAGDFGSEKRKTRGSPRKREE